ncbi:unnamed protein product, partial [Rotaria magnacalcarata]
MFMLNKLASPVNNSMLGTRAKNPNASLIALRYRGSQSDEKPTTFIFLLLHALYMCIHFRKISIELT